MVAKTAWHEVVAKLGPLPADCKTLNNDELSFLHSSLEQSRRAREAELDRSLQCWLERLPLLVRRAVHRFVHEH